MALRRAQEVAKPAETWQDGPFQRNKSGRPMIIPPGETKAVPYRRPSQLASLLDDKSGLADWKLNWLWVLLARTPPPPEDAFLDPATDWQKLVAKQKAMLEAPELTANRERGTRIHEVLEEFGRHGRIRPEFGPLSEVETTVVARFRELLEAKGITILQCETPLVNHAWRAAGTADALVLWNGEQHLADYKASKRPSGGYWACQLYLYATGNPLDDAVQWNPSRKVGLVFHIQVDVDPIKIDLYKVDLSKGRQFLALGALVEWARKVGGRTTNRLESCLEKLT